MKIYEVRTMEKTTSYIVKDLSVLKRYLLKNLLEDPLEIKEIVLEGETTIIGSREITGQFDRIKRYRDYKEQGLSLRKIGKLEGISNVSVYQFCKRHSI